MVKEMNGPSSGVTKMGKVTVKFEVANFGDIVEHERGNLPPDKIRRLVMQGVVDPGSMRLVLPEKVAKDLGLKVTGKVRVTYADKHSGLRDEVAGVYVTLLGRGGTFQAILEKKRDTALIGAIVLEDLDFLVDCTHQRLLPRDPKYVLSEIE